MDYSNRILSDFCIGRTASSNLREAALMAILDHTLDMMFIKTVDGIYSAASMSFVKMIGKERLDEVIGKTDVEICDDAELAARYVADDRRLLEGGKDLIGYIEPLPSESGGMRYGSTSKFILSKEDGTVIGLLGITRDITRDYLTRKYYENELSSLLNLTPDVYGAVFIDIENWRVINESRQSIDGIMLPQYGTVENLRQCAMQAIVDDNCEAAVFYKNLTREFLRDLYESGTSQISFEYLRHMPGAPPKWVRGEVRFLIDPETSHQAVMIFARDIDAEKQEELNLVASARLDKMTMVLNRETSMKEMNRILRDEPEKNHTLLLLDVDNFKNLNDTRGHQAGDQFLISLAKALRDFFRESDVIGRLGGDEFFVLMKDMDSREHVERRIEALLECIRTVCGEYAGVGLSVSIGISRYPKDGITLRELYGEADKALYRAKKSGKDRFCFT